MSISGQHKIYLVERVRAWLGATRGSANTCPRPVRHVRERAMCVRVAQEASEPALEASDRFVRAAEW